MGGGGTVEPGPSPRPPCHRVFFDSCDGIFTNYNWGEAHLERMQAAAGERLADVYVGVDVFARGNVVGGRFDTYKVGGGRPSQRLSRERQARCPSQRGKPRHRDTPVTCHAGPAS